MNLKPLEDYTAQEVQDMYERQRLEDKLKTLPVPKAPAKQPLWQMDVRQRLGLTPGRNDAISRLLMGALYAAEDEDDFVASIENHIDELRKAVAMTKGEE